MTSATCGDAVISEMIRSLTGLAAASPMSRLCISTASTMAMIASRMPMAKVPMPSQRAFPVTSETMTDTNAITSPSIAPKSSSRMTGSSGDLERRIKDTQEALPRTALDSFTAILNENASSTIAPPKMPMASPRLLRCSGWRILLVPSQMANTAPSMNSTRATTNDQKYRSRPKPKGCSAVGGLRARRWPNSKRAWLPESANEWKLSASIAPDLVTKKPTSLAIAMQKFALSAASIALVPCSGPPAMSVYL